jgi:glycosyltransferase involved in cell wall biosynthesis
MHQRIVVIPAFNEERLVGDVVADACRAAVADAVLVVDDGSTDRTAACARAAGALVVRHVMNRGAGAATLTGIQAALLMGADAVVTMDADGQHRGADAARIFRRLAVGDVDVVLGSRLKAAIKGDAAGAASAGGMPFRRRVYNRTGNLLTFLLFGLMVTDSQSGLKGFTRGAALRLDIRTNGPEFCSEVIKVMKERSWRFDEISIPAIYTTYSMSKGQNFRLGLMTAWQLLRAWFQS